MLYTNQNYCQAASRVKRLWLAFAAMTLIAAGIYAFMLVLRARWGAYAVLVAAMLLLSCFFAVCVRPAVKYKGFLSELDTGTHREVVCRVGTAEEREQLQDGVRVRAVEVQLLDGSGDTRLLYMNVSYMDRLPAQGSEAKLKTYGRHIIGIE